MPQFVIVKVKWTKTETEEEKLVKQTNKILENVLIWKFLCWFIGWVPLLLWRQQQETLLTHWLVQVVVTVFGGNFGKFLGKFRMFQLFSLVLLLVTTDDRYSDTNTLKVQASLYRQMISLILTIKTRMIRISGILLLLESAEMVEVEAVYSVHSSSWSRPWTTQINRNCPTPQHCIQIKRQLPSNKIVSFMILIEWP